MTWYKQGRMSAVYVRGAHNSAEDMVLIFFLLPKFSMSLGLNSLVISSWKTSALQGCSPEVLFQNMGIKAHVGSMKFTPTESF